MSPRSASQRPTSSAPTGSVSAPSASTGSAAARSASARSAPTPDAPCPIARAIAVLGDRWVLLILRNANTGMRRFDEFKADLGIADNILSTRLTRLVEAGLLTKVPYRDQGRTRHEYRLTRSGADMLPVLHALAEWGQQHTSPAEPTGPMRFRHRTCGQETAPGPTCTNCGEPLRREDEIWLRPWRAPHELTLADPIPEVG